MKKELFLTSLIVLISMLYVPNLYGQIYSNLKDQVQVIPENPSPTDSVYLVYSYVSNDGCPDYYLVKDSTTDERVFVSKQPMPNLGKMCTMIVSKFNATLNMGVFDSRTEIYYEGRLLKVIDPTTCKMDRRGQVIAVTEQSSIIKEQRTGDEYAINDAVLKIGSMVQFHGTRIQCITTPCYNIVDCYRIINNPLGSLSLSGQAFADSVPVQSGSVILFGKSYRKALNSTPLNNDGRFEFTEIPNGEYTVLVIPTHSTYKRYLPTFYIDKLRYQKADFVTLNEDMKGLDVKLRPYHRPNGNGRIYGNIRFESTTLKDSVIAACGLNRMNVQADAKLADNISIILFNANDEPIDWTITDTYGNYTFESLPNDTYKLVSETATASGETHVTLSNLTTAINADVMLKTIGVNTDTHNFKDNVLNFYPNPVTTTLTITLEETQKVHIYNIMGQEVTTKQLHEGSNTVDMSTMEKGVYFFKTNQATAKVVKK